MLTVLILLAALLFPVLGLGFLLWMAHLEDTLPRDVRATARKPAPPPILAIPVRPVERDASGSSLVSVQIPEQRTAPLVEAAPVAGEAGLPA